MRPAVRLALLTAAALGALGMATAASAQSYYGGQTYGPSYGGGYDRYTPPPPPPPTGQAFPRDDRYIEGPSTANSDGTAGYGPYVSQPDTSPDDPGRYAYDAARDRRVANARGYSDDDDRGPPADYAQQAYPPPRGADGYAYGPDRRGPSAYDDDEDEDDAPPPPAPRYNQGGYGQHGYNQGGYDQGRYGGGYPQQYAPYPPPRGW